MWVEGLEQRLLLTESRREGDEGEEEADAEGMRMGVEAFWMLDCFLGGGMVGVDGVEVGVEAFDAAR